MATLEKVSIEQVGHTAQALKAEGVPPHIMAALAEEVQKYADAARYGYVMPPSEAGPKAVTKAYGLAIHATPTGQRIVSIVVAAMTKAIA